MTIHPNFSQYKQLSQILTVCMALSFSIATHATTKTNENSTQQWQHIVEKAKGQRVFFNAWGGAENINDYIRWVAQQVNRDYGIELKHVKVSNTAEVVSRVLAEKTSAKTTDGSVDLIWINGENFRTMKERDLLADPWVHQLPNASLLDYDNKPSLSSDFQIDVNNQESPWGMAQLVFMYDSKLVQSPPRSSEELLSFAKQNPGRFSYPALPDFHGMTFIKQMLIEQMDDISLLSQPVSEIDFEQATAKLWQYLDQLHPQLWQGG